MARSPFVLVLTALAALVASPRAGAQPSASSPVARQGVVRDSVKMEVEVYKYAYVAWPYSNCGAGLYATWPDVLKDVLDRPTTYGDYGFVATEGQAFPRTGGQVVTDTLLNITVPDGFYGYGPRWGTGSQGGAGTFDPRCPDYYGYYRSVAGGAPGFLDGRPWRLTEWYATFEVPDGTPIALFDWEQAGGLSVAFDASFESEQSREIDETAVPAKKRPVVSYAWDFGDRREGSGARPTHAYDEPGAYLVTLTVTDDDGETDRYEETVTVAATTLSVEVESETDPVRLGEELSLVATVTNTGTDTAYDVVAEPVFALSLQFPDSLVVPGIQRVDPAFERVPAAAETVRIARLEPGESFEVRRWYKVVRVGLYRRSSRDPYRASPVEARAVLFSLTGKDDDGAPVKVTDVCEAGACSDQATVEVTRVDLAVKTFTTEELAPVETSTVTAGLLVGPDTIFPVVDGRPTRRVRHRVRVDGAPRCRSLCADFEVVATDPETGDPLPGVNLDLTPTISGPGIVTPGGVLCDRAQNVCGSSITLATDGFGRVEGYLAVPGVITPTPIVLTVQASASQPPTHAFVRGAATHPMTIAPNVLHDEAIPINAEQAEDLGAAAAIRLGFRRADLPSRLCKGVKKAFGTAKKASFIYGEAIPTEFINTVCKNVDELTLTGLLSAAQSSAQIPQMAWFFESTGLPSTGLAETVFRPMPAVSSQFVDAISAALEAQLDPAGEIAPGAAPFSLHEVSYLALEPGQPYPVRTDALYLRMWSHFVLVKADYDAGIWLLERYDRDVRPRLASPVGRGALEVSVEPPAGASVAPGPPGDPGARSLGTAPASAPGRAAWAHPAVPDSLVAVPDSLYANAIVVLSPDDPAIAETVRVLSVTGDRTAGQAAELASPLVHSHPAGAPVRVLGDGQATPPRLYPVAPVDTVVTEATMRVLWATTQPVAEVDVEIARDAAFTDRVMAETFAGLEIADGAVDVGVADVGLAADTPYYWRARARDRAGESAWSDTTRFVATSRATAGDEDGGRATVLRLTVHPNPASEEATVALAIPLPGRVRMVIYDALGRQVAVPIDADRSAGRHEVSVRLEGLPAGVYAVRVEAPGGGVTQRLTVVR